MKIEYKTDFEGFIPILRAALLLIKEKNLSFAQFGAYIMFTSQANYNKRNKYYGYIIRSDKEIGRALDYDSTAIYKLKIALIKKGLFQNKDGLTYIPNFYLFKSPWPSKLAKIPSSFLQDLFVNPQEEVEGLQGAIAKLQESKLDKTSRFKVSSKFNLSSSNGDPDNGLKEETDDY